jgi:hypothetical protein
MKFWGSVFTEEGQSQWALYDNTNENFVVASGPLLLLGSNVEVDVAVLGEARNKLRGLWGELFTNRPRMTEEIRMWHSRRS